MKQYLGKIFKEEYERYIRKKDFLKIVQKESMDVSNDFVVSSDIAMTMHFLPSWCGVQQPNHRPMFRHCHDCFEFIYVCQGKFYNAVEKPETILDEKHVILIPPGYYHAPYTASDDDWILNILIKPQLMERILFFFGKNEMELMSFFYEYVYGLPVSMPYLFLEKTPQIQETVEKMVKEYSYFEPARAPLIVSYFSELLVYMAQSYKKMELTSQKTGSKGQEIVAYIRTHYLSVTRSELCECSHYSPAHLSSIIKQETGKTFKELVLGYKMESACNLLKSTSFSVEKISEILNYKDAYYLSKVFKAEMKMTPSEYRKKCR